MNITVTIDDNEIASLCKSHAESILDARGYGGSNLRKMIEARVKREVESMVNRGGLDSMIEAQARAAADRIAQEEAERVVRRWAKKRIAVMGDDAIRQLAMRDTT